MTVTTFTEPIVFANSQPENFKFTTGQSGLSTIQAFRITNVSPYVIAVRFGSDASTFNLSPGQVNVWSYTQNQGALSFTFPAQPNLPQTGYVIIEASDNGAADFPGNYPSSLALSSVSIDGNINATITAGVVEVTQSTASSLNALTIGGIPASTFGTGSDGAVTIGANTTLTRDYNYTSLTVDSGVTLSTGGYIIRCTGTVTNNGTIDNSASGQTPGAAGSIAGGASGVTVSGGSSVGLSPTSATVEGGDGGSLSGYAGGVTVAPLTSSLPLVQGVSMSGGASGAATAVSPDSAFSGGGGGVVYLAAATVAGTGTFSAKGGDATSESSSSAGGGGAGVIAILTHTNDFTGTYDVSGGAGGANGSPYTAYDGKAGQALVYVA